MNYQKIYDDICLRGQTRILDKSIYSEKHHIAPRCLGGSNDKSNISKLTAREHFLVHYILATKLYPENKKLIYALCAMFSYKNIYQMRYIPSLRTCSEIRQKRSEYINGEKNPMFGKCHNEKTRQKISKTVREKNIGKKHPLLGKHHSEETRKKMSETAKKRTSEKSPNFGRHFSGETRQKMSKAQKGKKRSEETKIKISERFKGENHPMFGKHHTNEACRKISAANKDRVLSEELRQKLAELNTGENNGMFGKHHSEETKMKISKSQKNRYAIKNKINKAEK